VKYLVAYYSNSGTTRVAAESIARMLGADLEVIEEKRPRPVLDMGPGKAGGGAVARAGIAAMLGLGTRLAPSRFRADEYEVVVVGTPVWVGSVTPPVRSYLRRQRIHFRSVAFFCTAGDPATMRAFRQMEDLVHRQPVASIALKSDDVKSGAYEDMLAGFIEAIQRS
jgi:menaquinone-dependent protoporphyrinogen IX oxidase